MNEETATPYKLRTEYICDVVCESTADYGKPIAYQGTTIANALKDYYTFSTNREKVDVLKFQMEEMNQVCGERLPLQNGVIC